MEIGQRSDAGPDLLVGGSKRTEDAEELVNLAIAREERITCQHLSEDATQTPDVDRSGVVSGAQQNLGRSVPQGDDLLKQTGCILVRHAF